MIGASSANRTASLSVRDSISEKPLVLLLILYLELLQLLLQHVLGQVKAAPQYVQTELFLALRLLGMVQLLAQLLEFVHLLLAEAQRPRLDAHRHV